MKISILLTLLVSISTPSPATAWSLPQLPFSSLSPRNLPTFILDTRHPWLSENHRRLARTPNITAELCHLNSTLWITDPRPPPPDLFHTLRIDDNIKNGVSRKGWPNAVARLREMRACPAALDGVRKLKVSIYVHDSKYDDFLMREPSAPPKMLPELAAEVLGKMANLEDLEWGMPTPQEGLFEVAFREAGLRLPRVKKLLVGKGADWLVGMCPNVEKIVGGGYFHHWSWNTYVEGFEIPDAHLRLVRAAAAVGTVKELVLDTGWRGWNIDLLEAIVESLPNLMTLSMSGGLDARPYMYLYDDDWVAGATLRKFLAVIGRLSKLENLALPASYELDVGFDGGPKCGNAYMGPEGKKYRERVIQQASDATVLAGTITMEELGYLKYLTIGSSCANLTMGDQGTTEVLWPWSS